MNDWKQRLYDGYVSTGQAGPIDNPLHFDNPYYDKIIADHLPANPDISVLDLGCGHGRLIYSLKKHGYNNILGIDISAEQVAVAHKFGIEEVQCQDLSTFVEKTADKSYNAIFLMDILEHLDKQELFDLLDNVNRILANNGMVVLHIPNGAGIFGMRTRYGDFTHKNAFTSTSIQQILHACNFNQVLIFEDKPIVHGLKSLARHIIWQVLSLPLRLLLIAETGTTQHILSQNILVVAKKNGELRQVANFTLQTINEPENTKPFTKKIIQNP